MSSAILLLLSLIGLATGPVLVSVWPQGQAWRALLTGLSLVLVGGLGLLVLLPHAIEHSGILSVFVGVAAVGLLGQLRHTPGASRGRLALLVSLLLLHAALDGAALLVADDRVGLMLGLTVTAHRLPMGLALFLGTAAPRTGWLLIGGLMVATLLGFWGSSVLISAIPDWASGMLEAMVIGALLHVTSHAHPAPAGGASVAELRRWASLGGVLGGALAVVLAGLSWGWAGCS